MIARLTRSNGSTALGMFVSAWLVLAGTGCSVNAELAPTSDGAPETGTVDAADAEEPGSEVADVGAFPPFVPDPAIDCGPGCKIVSGPVDPRSHPFAGYGDTLVVGFAPTWYSVSTGTSVRVPPFGKGHSLFPDMFGTAFATTVDVDKGHEEVQLLDLAAHTSESVYTSERPAKSYVDTVALSPNYVFWQQVGVGVTAFHRKTKVSKTLAPLLDCLYFGGLSLKTPTGLRDTLLCGEVNSTTLLIDAETGTAKRVDASKAYQLFGNPTKTVIGSCGSTTATSP